MLIKGGWEREVMEEKCGKIGERSKETRKEKETQWGVTQTPV